MLEQNLSKRGYKQCPFLQTYTSKLTLGEGGVIVVHSHAVILMLLSLLPESFGIFLPKSKARSLTGMIKNTSFQGLSWLINSSPMKVIKIDSKGGIEIVTREAW